MNKAMLMGRLTKDPELRTTANNVSVCSFTLAVDRRFKNPDGEYEADFIPIVAWRHTAEFAARYFHKGSRMLLVGSIRPRSWEDQDGNRRYTTEVIADEIYFCDSKKGSSDESDYGKNHDDSSVFRNSIPEGEGYLPDDDGDVKLPFNL